MLFALVLTAHSAIGVFTDQHFVFGDASTLTCKASRSTPKKWQPLLLIEVKNRGPSWAEPLVFSIEIKTKKSSPGFRTHHRVQRVMRPFFGRAGRAVRPGGTETFGSRDPGPGRKRFDSRSTSSRPHSWPRNRRPSHRSSSSQRSPTRLFFGAGFPIQFE